MDSSRPLCLAVFSLAAALAAPLRASAEPPPPAPKVDADDEAGPDAGSRHPLAPDMRTGNIYLAGKFGVTPPAGHLALVPPNSLTASRATADITGTGMSFGGTLGVGISRHASFDASGAYSLFGSPTGCGTQCKGHSYDLGLGLSYHVAQGVAVDPWGSFGLGYRAATFITKVDTSGAATGVPNTQQYRGFDFARIALGADFYPTPFFGFGPYFEVDVGASLNPPAGSPPVTGVATYAFVHFGVRLAFDPFRSASASSRPRGVQAHR